MSNSNSGRQYFVSNSSLCKTEIYVWQHLLSNISLSIWCQTVVCVKSLTEVYVKQESVHVKHQFIWNSTLCQTAVCVKQQFMSDKKYFVSNSSLSSLSQTVVYVKQKFMSNSNLCQTVPFVKKQFLSSRRLIVSNRIFCQSVVCIKQQFASNSSLFSLSTKGHRANLDQKQMYDFKLSLYNYSNFIQGQQQFPCLDARSK